MKLQPILNNLPSWKNDSYMIANKSSMLTMASVLLIAVIKVIEFTNKATSKLLNFSLVASFVSMIIGAAIIISTAIILRKIITQKKEVSEKGREYKKFTYYPVIIETLISINITLLNIQTLSFGIAFFLLCFKAFGLSIEAAILIIVLISVIVYIWKELPTKKEAAANYQNILELEKQLTIELESIFDTAQVDGKFNKLHLSIFDKMKKYYEKRMVNPPVLTPSEQSRLTTDQDDKSPEGALQQKLVDEIKEVKKKTKDKEEFSEIILQKFEIHI